MLIIILILVAISIYAYLNKHKSKANTSDRPNINSHSYHIESKKFDEAVAVYKKNYPDNFLEKAIKDYEEQQLEKHFDNLIKDYEEQQLEKHLKYPKKRQAYFPKKKIIQKNGIVPAKQVRFESLMKEYNIIFFYHMTHISNIESIFKNNLLSHNKAHSSSYVNQDISMSSVNNRRNKILSINGQNLHDYVPLYIKIKNPMLFCRKDIGDDLVILNINKRILLDNENVIFSDGNAASGNTVFFNHLEDLEKLNWKCLNNPYWNDYDDGKRIKCAEILVKDEIKCSEIKKIICKSSLAEAKVRQRIPKEYHDLTDINKDYFF